MRHIVLNDPWIDEHWLAVNKPAGIATHSPDTHTPGLYEQWCASLGEKLGIHHRLDAGTSGVIVFSRTPEGAAALARAFENRLAHKRYLAITSRPVDDRRGLLEDRLLRRGGKTHVDRTGKEARSRIRMLDQRGGWTVYEVEPITGRTHQIRVQLASRGAPVLGDDLYGGGSGPGRMMLHARELMVDHPVEGPLRLEAPPDWSWWDGARLDADRLFEAVVQGLPVTRAADDALRLGVPVST